MRWWVQIQTCFLLEERQGSQLVEAEKTQIYWGVRGLGGKRCFPFLSLTIVLSYDTNPQLPYACRLSFLSEQLQNSSLTNYHKTSELYIMVLYLLLESHLQASPTWYSRCLLSAFSLPSSSKTTSWISLYQPLYMALHVSPQKAHVSSPKTLSYLAHVLHRCAGEPQWHSPPTAFVYRLMFLAGTEKMWIVSGFCLSPVVLEQLQRSRKAQSWLLLGFKATVCPSSWCFASQTELAIFYVLNPCMNIAVANPHVCGKKTRWSLRS